MHGFQRGLSKAAFSGAGEAQLRRGDPPRGTPIPLNQGEMLKKPQTQQSVVLAQTSLHLSALRDFDDKGTVAGALVVAKHTC